MNFKKIKNYFYSDNSVSNERIQHSANYSEWDALFDTDLQSILLVDLEGKIIKANHTFYYFLEQIQQKGIHTGSSIYDIIASENQDQFKHDFLIALNGSKTKRERWVKDVEGKSFCFLYEYTPIKKSGKVEAVLMSILDITDMVASKLLSESQEQQYFALVDGHNSALLISRLDGLVLNVNDSAQEMFGYTKEEFLTLTRKDYIDQEDVRLDDLLKKRIDQGIVQGELIGIKKNGRRFPIEVSSVLFENSVTGEKHASTLINDISNKKRDQQILIETNRVARVGGWELDLISKTLYWSDVTKEIHGVSLNFEPDFETAIRFYSEGEDRDRIVSSVEQSIKTAEPFEDDFRITTVSGELKWIRIKGLAEVHKGVVTRLYGTFQDIDKYKRIEIALLESENQLSAYFNSTTDYICLIDKNYLVLGFNKVFEESVSQIWKKQIRVGDNILDYNTPETIDNFKLHYSHALNGERIQLERNLFVHNYKAWWSVNYIPINDAKGEIIGVAFTAADISLRKKTELDLIESKNQIEKSLNELQHQRFALDQHALVCVTNTDSEIIYVNDKYAELSGYTKEELIDKPSSILKSQVHKPEFFKELNETIFNGKVWTGDICNVKKNGQHYWLRMTIVPFRDHKTNQIKQFISICNDITDKREEEIRLKLLESVITNTNDAVIITEAEPINLPGPRILYVNDAFCKMTGYTKEEVIGKSPRILQGELSDKNELAKLRKALENWQSHEIEIINYTKSGEPFWVNFSVVPIADETGWYTHWISVQRDTTIRKKYEEERQHLIDELSSSINELKQYTYITSHNMRAPVTNLIGIFNILDTSTIKDEFTLQLIDGLKRSTYNLNDTLNDLIKILIIKENTNQGLDYVRFEDTLENVKRSIASILDTNDATIYADFSSAEKVLFNKSYLDSIFLNLITNSVRYSDSQRRTIINITSEEDAEYIKLIYADNGLGMNMNKVRGQIFGLYKRFHNHPESKGVGLYLVHSQVTSLGGFIDVQSEENVGTTFTITFKK